MFTAIVIVTITMIVASIVTLFAFSWAASHDQFEDLDEAAEVIFDADEPIGEPTDPELSD